VTYFMDGPEDKLIKYKNDIKVTPAETFNVFDYYIKTVLCN